MLRSRTRQPMTSGLALLTHSSLCQKLNRSVQLRRSGRASTLEVMECELIASSKGSAGTQKRWTRKSLVYKPTAEKMNVLTSRGMRKRKETNTRCSARVNYSFLLQCAGSHSLAVRVVVAVR